MAYSNVPIGTSNPGCIVILVDQSWSMSEGWQTGTKAEGAALAVNRVIEELVLACRRGDVIRERCHISVIGYGEDVECLVEGMISDVASSLIEVKRGKKLIPDGAGGVIEIDNEMPIWLEPQAGNGTPMHTAFELAAEVVEQWCVEWPNGFPPIVINITDGAASHPDLTAYAARRVMNLQTTDGNALVFNLHIASSGNRAFLPRGPAQFAGDFLAEFLFEISSVLPSSLHALGEAEGIQLEADARCFLYNGDETQMIKLLQFGSLDLTQVQALPQPSA